MRKYHLSKPQIFLYLLDEVSPEEKRAVEEHVQVCQRCAELLVKEKNLFQLINKQPRPEPKEYLLKECRARLTNRLREKSTLKSQKKPWLEFLNSLFYPTVTKRVAAVAAVFLVGLAAGRFFPYHKYHRDSKQALLAMESCSPIMNFQIIPSTKKPDQVEIRFNTLQEKTLRGSLKNPDIQYALSYALVNEPRENIRLKIIGLLKDTSRNEFVEKALIQALKNDKNPGIRWKAIKILKTLPVNESIKKVLIYALFKDPNSGIRIAAANTLYQTKNTRIRSILQKRL